MYCIPINFNDAISIIHHHHSGTVLLHHCHTRRSHCCISLLQSQASIVVIQKHIPSPTDHFYLLECLFIQSKPQNNVVWNFLSDL
jgi:hypothetical protein